MITKGLMIGIAGLVFAGVLFACGNSAVRSQSISTPPPVKTTTYPKLMDTVKIATGKYFFIPWGAELPGIIELPSTKGASRIESEGPEPEKKRPSVSIQIGYGEDGVSRLMGIFTDPAMPGNHMILNFDPAGKSDRFKWERRPYLVVTVNGSQRDIPGLKLENFEFPILAGNDYMYLKKGGGLIMRSLHYEERYIPVQGGGLDDAGKAFLSGTEKGIITVFHEDKWQFSLGFPGDTPGDGIRRAIAGAAGRTLVATRTSASLVDATGTVTDTFGIHADNYESSILDKAWNLTDFTCSGDAFWAVCTGPTGIAVIGFTILN